MSKSSSYFDPKNSTNVRPGLSHLQPEQQSPKTPPRFTTSSFPSPSASFRGEEESLVFEFGARHFSAGLASESSPRCRLGFGPEESRRVGDYRKWLPGYQERHRSKRNGYDWGEDHELWRMDMRELDLRLVEAKVERAIRDAYSKYLLLDAKSRRLVILVPSIMPHPLLSSILNTVFLNFHIPGITLLSNPLVCTVAAGCRSGLVVDIGWSETIVTGIYEYREVNHLRTTRAMKEVTREMAKTLHYHYTRPEQAIVKAIYANENEVIDTCVDHLFEHSEEMTMRMAWCWSLEEASKFGPSAPSPHRMPINGGKSIDEATAKYDPSMTIPSPFAPHQNFQIPFSHFAIPVERVLLSKSTERHDIDEHEQPLHLLIYKALLSLPPDVRSVCMSRIIITGGGSNIPGLKSRLLEEVSELACNRAWDPVYGRAVEGRRRRLVEISNNRGRAPPMSRDTQEPTAQLNGNLASNSPPIPDPIEEKLKLGQVKDSQPSVTGVIRGVETLGAWEGGSLLAGLKIKGIVDIDRDFFLQHGLAGAKRDVEPSVMPARQSYGSGVPRAGVGDRTSWTLGAWG